MSSFIKIAVVDDEEDFHVLFKMTFKKLIRSGELQIFNFLNGEECLQFFEKDNNLEGIKIVFSDINMPKMDGISLCREMRSKFPDIGMYVASAYATQDYIDQAKEVGAIDFFSKPIDFSLIGKIITSSND
jgi:CheY-like chemotaxis protein